MATSGNAHLCATCGIQAPQVDNFTLIGSEHGWRLSRTKDANGKHVIVWHCPKCFALKKKSVG